MDLLQEFFQHFPPLARVALAFFLILVVPMLCRRFSLPAVVGLLGAGVVSGCQAVEVAPGASSALMARRSSPSSRWWPTSWPNWAS
jgi:Kef-type K+ transport system membrane component KefB